MCRKNQLWGWMLIAFGVGILVCLCLSSHFVRCCAGFGCTILGFCRLHKK